MLLGERNPLYGHGDSTYIAAGEESGIETLVDHFYDVMESDTFARPLRNLHADDLTESRSKLTAFLCGWMGGPKRYQERYGSINIPSAHAHLNVEESHAKQWIYCMHEALNKMDYPDTLKEYLIEQLSVPVNMVLKRAQIEQASG